MMTVKVWLSQQPHVLAHAWNNVDRIEHSREGVAHIYSKTSLLGAFGAGWLWLMITDPIDEINKNPGGINAAKS